MPKSFYRGDEVAYFNLSIDNSQVTAKCSLNVTHQMRITHFNTQKHSWSELQRIQKKRYEGIAAANEPQKMVSLVF